MSCCDGDDGGVGAPTLGFALREVLPVQLGMTSEDIRVEGTRELACPPLPFIAIYEVLETPGEVWMLRILHGAQQWPPR